MPLVYTRYSLRVEETTLHSRIWITVVMLLASELKGYTPIILLEALYIIKLS